MAKMHANNSPLKGYKGSENEGGIRVPFLLSMPKTLPENTKYDFPVISLDLFPTFLSLAGGNPALNPKPLDGVNLLPYLKNSNKNAPHDILFWQRNNIAARRGDWKIIKNVRKKETYLYNLKNDIGEKKNLEKKYPEIIEELEKEIVSWQNQHAERMN